ncbi:MAG: hypothetical protein JWR68_2319 [Polaromonas sp.]|nr:hypothetical protein [Polaromonas sp.]
MKNMQEEMDFLRSLSQELIQEKVNLLTLVNEISECLEAVDGRLAETVSEIIEASLNSAQANASLASYRTGHLISQF